MANFTNETEVREKFQLSDTTLVPSALVTSSIDDAHDEILRFLSDSVDTGSPEDALIMGECLLSGAHLLRSLASKDAFGQKQISIGGHKVDAGKRFDSFMDMASKSEKQAWYMLEPYLKEVPTRPFLDVSETKAVLGEDG